LWVQTRQANDVKRALRGRQPVHTLLFYYYFILFIVVFFYVNVSLVCNFISKKKKKCALRQNGKVDSALTTKVQASTRRHNLKKRGMWQKEPPTRGSGRKTESPTRRNLLETIIRLFKSRIRPLSPFLTSYSLISFLTLP
jgi:hypothetical protein